MRCISITNINDGDCYEKSKNNSDVPFVLYTPKGSLCQLYLASLSVAGCLFRIHVEKVHLATKWGQEVQEQAVFGHLKYKYNALEIMIASIQTLTGENIIYTTKYNTWFETTTEFSSYTLTQYVVDGTMV